LTTGNSVGTFTVPNLLPGKAYVFYLSDSACNNLLLTTSVIVPTDFIPPVIPMPPLPTPVCFTNSPNIFVNQTVNFFASGGNGNYTWNSSNSSPSFGQGQNFSTNFTYPGNFTITVQSNGQSANCFVNVQASQTVINPIVTYQTPPPPLPQPQIAGAFTAPKTGAETNAFVFAGLLTFAFALYKKRSLLKKLIF
jgi:LPXTG-motif cell wall-anchored protein